MDYYDLQKILKAVAKSTHPEILAMENEYRAILNQYYTREQVIPEELQHQIIALRQAQDIVYQITQGPRTDMISAMNDAFKNFDVPRVSRIIEATVSQRMIEAADIAAIKTVNNMFDLQISYPAGFISLLQQLTKSTVDSLWNSLLKYDTGSRSFKTRHGETANAKELNDIYRCKAVVNDFASAETFTDEELVNFMNDLYKNRSFAHNTNTGRKIFDLLKDVFEGNVGHMIDFDKNVYYHARTRKNEEMPYLAEQMLKAPAELSAAGRFNYPGQSHYYFANTIGGAINEVTKHADRGDDVHVQVASIKPHHGLSVKLIDLSVSRLNGKKFLDYIRKEVPDYYNMPRQYLIPIYVADCCKYIGFDGIKYYGRQDYSNYVVWNDGYFELCEMIRI